MSTIQSNKEETRSAQYRSSSISSKPKQPVSVVATNVRSSHQTASRFKDSGHSYVIPTQGGGTSSTTASRD